MAQSHVVSGLISKRVELAGQIDAYRTQLDVLHNSITHLDKTIRLFDPEVDLATIKVKRAYTRNPLMTRGGVQNALLDIFRKSNCPLTSAQLSTALLQAKGMDVDSKQVIQTQKNIFAILARLEKRAVIRQLPRGDECAYARWELA